MIPKRTKDKVCITGFAPSKIETPFGDDEFERWTINEMYVEMPFEKGKWTRWFDLHSDLQERAIKNERCRGHLDNLEKIGQEIPLLMMHTYDKTPSAKRFPYQILLDKYGDYFTNTISWLVALAIEMEFKEIWVVGVDMAQATEYCVAPETKILTADLRWAPASGVKQGDHLMGFDEEIPEGMNYRYWRKTEVLGTKRLTRPCYRLTMADGTELISSSEHRWLEDHAQFRWTTTENLRPPIATEETYSQLEKAYKNKEGTIEELAERFGVSWQLVQRITSDNYNLGLAKAHRLVKLTEMWEQDFSWGSGLLAGGFDSEGHLSQLKRPTNNGMAMSLGFSQKDNPLAKAIKQELIARGFSVNGHEVDGCWKWEISGSRERARTRRDEILRFLGSTRPPRLLEKFNPDMMGVMHKKDGVRIVKKEFIGEQEVIGLTTTTGTFVANGYASHNSNQRPSCEYFIGLARGKGITVRIPPTSDLCKTHEPYGVGTGAFQMKLQAREEELEQRKQQHEAERAKATDSVNQMIGRVEELQNTVRAMKPPDNIKAEMEKRLNGLRGKIEDYQREKANHHDAINQINGAIQNNQYILASWTSPIDKEIDIDVESAT